MERLINEKILSIEIDKNNQHYLRFKTDAEEILYFAEGDCCSESWFYHVLGVDALLNQVVTGHEEVYMGDIDDDGKTRQEFDALYKITLTTQKGHCDIEFRNSSNGYYGGWVGRVDQKHADRDEVEFIQITKDFTTSLDNAHPPPAWRRAAGWAARVGLRWTLSR